MTRQGVEARFELTPSPTPSKDIAFVAKLITLLALRCGPSNRDINAWYKTTRALRADGLPHGISIDQFDVDLEL